MLLKSSFKHNLRISVLFSYNINTNEKVTGSIAVEWMPIVWVPLFLWERSENLGTSAIQWNNYWLFECHGMNN